MREALTRLDRSGYAAFLVGGSVRDSLLQKPVKDFDVATNATPDEVCALFPRAITVGKAFGVIRTEHVEIATFRKDLSYKDHRHPTGVQFASPEEDAARRDFTINALFYDPKTARILDCVGGLDDLRAGIIRAIGDPAERFREDALRLLRAVRFSGQLGFPIEEKTREAIRAKAKLVGKVSAERIAEELTRIWMGPRPGEMLEELKSIGLLFWLLPEVDRVKTLGPTARLLGELKRSSGEIGDRVLAWAAVLHSVGRPEAGRSRPDGAVTGHELIGAKIARSVAERLHFSRADTDAISELVGGQYRIRGVFGMRDATIYRMFQDPWFEEALALSRALSVTTDGNQAQHDFCAALYREWKEGRDSHPGAKLITGEDLIQLGLRPGPRFAEILRSVEDLMLEGKLKSKNEALEYVLERFVN